MRKKRKKNEEILDSHAKSSTISGVYRCCCNFVSSKSSTMSMILFLKCVSFPDENLQPVLRGHVFSEEKRQFSLDVKQKRTFYKRKSTKKEIRSGHSYNIFFFKKKMNFTIQQEHPTTGGQFDVPVWLSSQSVPYPCGRAGW